MADYIRTVWKDHIKDQNGAVIQQGTPVSAQKLNNMENKIVELSAKENTLAELIREEIPSGFTSLSDIDYTYMSTNPNAIKLSSDSVAYVNGYKVIIPAGTIITLDAPPTAGSRDDLVFLECWKQTDSNGSISWNYRIRVVNGVDFANYSEGILNTSFVKTRGGNSIDTTYTFSKSSTDAGLYISGSGSSTDKTALATTDGYVYAIPMFRIRRRNSGVYSVINGNGANTFYSIKPTVTVPIAGGLTAQVTFADTSSLQVGDIFYRSDSTNVAYKIMSIDSSTLATVLALYDISSTFSFTTSFFFYRKSTRYDSTYSNIVAERDIIDLRHQVSFTGFSYQQLLEENFDRLLRGGLQTNAKTTMLKTYHGVAKTPIDANHVFYASFDGTTTAEVGGDTGISLPNYRPVPTGLGSTKAFSKSLTGLTADVITIDMGLWLPDGKVATSGSIGSSIFDIKSASGTHLIKCVGESGTGSYCTFQFGTASNAWEKANLGRIDFVKGMNHIRLAFESNIAYMYHNGKLVGTANIGRNLIETPATLSTLAENGYVLAYDGTLAMFDVSISNINRGLTFATLPQDFIDRYARVDKAFNSQRKVFSDALTSETLTAQVKATGSNNKEITITQATGGVWATNDTLKIKGLGGEIITGVIDTDTALARIVQSGTAPNTVIYVDDISKFVTSDSIVFYDPISGAVSYQKTILSIDTVNKTITLDSAINNASGNWNITAGQHLIFETTASSSAPTVKTTVTGQAQAGALSTITLPTTFNPTDDAYNGLTITITGGTGAGQVRTITDYVGSTKVATVNSAWTTNPDNTSIFTISGVTVAGTWSNLGTNQATFTLGTLYALATQDIVVSYSLNEVAGQGGIPEVLTTTLAGEYGGKKLAVNPTVHLRDDFVGKVAGSTTVNPNIFKRTAGGASGYTVLQAPTSANFTEVDQTYYDAVPTLDGNTKTLSNTGNGQIPQYLFSFNLIEIIERKYGTIPALDIAVKVAWLKANLSSVKCNLWGYGSCPSGPKISMRLFSNNTNSWIYNGATHTYGSINNLSMSFAPNDGAIYIDANGSTHFIAYTDASDGVTASAIYTDYINIELVFTTASGYDILAPENPRRDDGLSNMLLVRKETKEIQAMFGGVSNTSGIVTYGDYLPYQGVTIAVSSVDSTLSIKAKNKNLIGNAGTGKYNTTLMTREDQLPTGINRSYYMNSSAIGYFRLEELNNLISSNNDINNPFVSMLRNFSSDLFGSLFVSSNVKKLRGFAPGQGTSRNIDVSNILTRFGLSINSYVISGLIISYQGNIYLVIVRTDVNSDKTIWAGGQSLNAAVDIFYLPGRPLIK